MASAAFMQGHHAIPGHGVTRQNTLSVQKVRWSGGD